MRVFVINNFACSRTPAVQAHHDVLLVPSVMKNAGRFHSFRFPDDRLHGFRGRFVAGGKNYQWSAGFQAKIRELRSEDIMELFEFLRYATRIAGAAIAEDTEMRAVDFDPGFVACVSASENRKQETAHNENRSATH